MGADEPAEGGADEGNAAGDTAHADSVDKIIAEGAHADAGREDADATKAKSPSMGE